MRSRRRTETTTESHEIWVIRRLGGASPAWCGECADRSTMLVPEAAAKLSNVTTRTIYRWVEAGRVHFAEAADGSLLICLASLTAEDTAPVPRNGSGPAAPG